MKGLTPFLFRDAHKTLYLLTHGTLSAFRINATFIELLSYLRESLFKALAGSSRSILCRMDPGYSLTGSFRIRR